MPRFPYALVCCWSRRAVTKKHWTNSTAAHWSPRGSKLSASLYQGRSLKLPTNTTLSMLCMYHTIFQWINTVFSIFVAHLYFSPYAPDKVVGVYLRAMLCKNMVMVTVECMLDVCKLNVSLVCLHYNAKRYGGCLSWSWRILEEYLWYSKFFYGHKVNWQTELHFPPSPGNAWYSFYVKSVWFQRSTGLLTDLISSFIQMASHSNYWPRESQHLRTWSSRSGLDFHYNPETSYMSILYHRGGSLEDRTEISQRGICQCLHRLCMKISAPALTFSLLNT